MSRVDYGFNQWSVVSFIIKKCTYLWRNSVYIQLYSCTLCRCIFTFYDLKIYRFCRISEFFVDPTRNVNYIEKQNSEKIQRVKIRLNLKTNGISLIISSNLLCFNFTKSRQKTSETINDSNLRGNKANLALVSYVMKPLKSAYLLPSVLVVGLYQTH